LKRRCKVNNKPVNIQQRVEFTRGLIGALEGESQGRALERVLPELNSRGYRVVFMVKDEWNFLKKFLFTWVFAIITLGLYYRAENWLIIAELIELESTKS
jgi:hypothetical protein